MSQTSRFGSFRSKELKTLDEALRTYEASPTDQKLDKVKEAFEGWKTKSEREWSESKRNRAGAVTELEEKLKGTRSRFANDFHNAREGLLYLYTAFGLMTYMLRDHRVSGDELFAAGATFTLLAWAFAFAYSVCQTWYPQSFTGYADAAAPRSWVELLYLSFSTLSGVGLSDIMPVRPQARALVMLEQFAGVMYIALVVSRLIGLATSRALMRRD